MTPPAVVAWAAHWGRLQLDGTPLAFLDSTAARYILVVAMLAPAELVADKLPFTPARTGIGSFTGRIVSGALSGAALTVGLGGSLAVGAAAGGLGAVVGTLAGYRARTGIVRASACAISRSQSPRIPSRSSLRSWLSPQEADPQGMEWEFFPGSAPTTAPQVQSLLQVH